MKMRFLGNTGFKVSELCFGAMTFGKRGFFKEFAGLDQKAVNTLVDMALEAGINFFDTADIYQEGESEELLGKALGERRKQIVLATKVWGKVGPGPNDLGLSRHHVIEGCDASLKRLGTDYIDLYQLHGMDFNTPLDETLRALDDLVRQGKVRYIGCSNLTSWQLMKALAISDKRNLERFITLQAHYSLIARELEYELVPLCLDQGLGILTWSPLSGGFLSGKYRRGQPRPQGARMSDPHSAIMGVYDEQRGFDIVESLDKIATEHQRTVAQVALNYLLRKPGVTSIIIGARTPDQLADNLKTADWELTADEVAKLDEISKIPSIYPHWWLKQASLSK
jgi:aryl-alcohol dehydrogenase-like predicted oxidoreductase